MKERWESGHIANRSEIWMNAFDVIRRWCKTIPFRFNTLVLLKCEDAAVKRTAVQEKGRFIRLKISVSRRGKLTNVGNERCQ